MLAGTRGWQEFLCLTVLAYTGVRRNSASRLRWKDVDLDAGTVTFRDKGSKYAERPISDDLVAILKAARESGDLDCRPHDYVIPNRRGATVRRAERCNKVIWNTVVIVA